MMIEPQQVHSEPFTVLGPSIRTDGASSARDIPALWASVMADDTLARIPGRRSGDIYAVYTHLEHAARSRDGWFTFLIGVAVDPSTAIDDGFTVVSVPASPRVQFPVPDGDPSRVLEAWEQAWAHDDTLKTFICEYEHYGADGSVSVNLGVR
ncbi:GyrI-like domain-containing protein [Ruania rhizosphaerae]|uniref:GyrI-like domain-containing protein n=1 Tax=Ruania rhizosphaerae TaxID=1840413 RepID=UPI00135AAE98|nr:GyrI-like domain-containing protein [Ruania rhizosphaerae]